MPCLLLLVRKVIPSGDQLALSHPRARASAIMRLASLSDIPPPRLGRSQPWRQGGDGPGAATHGNSEHQVRLETAPSDSGKSSSFQRMTKGLAGASWEVDIQTLLVSRYSRTASIPLSRP